ncbi:MAG: hypothetical protein IJT48_12605, partial [Bacteroidaceae bacterium]|nr:hypothetical protein [Bacteroidaceae bacterium]
TPAATPAATPARHVPSERELKALEVARKLASCRDARFRASMFVASVLQKGREGEELSTSDIEHILVLEKFLAVEPERIAAAKAAPAV